MATAKRSLPPMPLLVGGAVVIGLAAYGAVQLMPPSLSERAHEANQQALAPQEVVSVPAQRGMADDPQPRPVAWYFDAPNNRHWHEPHDHWHPGPPPPVNMRHLPVFHDAPQTMTFPPRAEPRVTLPDTFPPGQEPPHLFHDLEGNRHWWGPHTHWHPGAPPDDAE